MRYIGYSALLLLGLAGCSRKADAPVATEAIIEGLGTITLP